MLADIVNLDTVTRKVILTRISEFIDYAAQADGRPAKISHSPVQATLSRDKLECIKNLNPVAPSGALEYT